jgi:hypothetical protein
MAHPIGIENESSLHAALKRWYAEPGDRLEVALEGYIIDIVRGDTLIEIQTGDFYSIRPKVKALLENHILRLVYPVAKNKWLIKLDPDTGERIGRRKSPKHGSWADLFDELIRFPHLANHPNLQILVALTQEEELRCADGQGSWRRKGVSIVDHLLLEVVEQRTFRDVKDYLALLPNDLESPFTNRQLANQTSLRMRQAQRMTYCLYKMGALERVGRQGRAHLYARTKGLDQR